MLLPPSSSCSPQYRGVSDADQAMILEMHNLYRVKVAQGNEASGDPGPQPTGANIRELKWNDELAKVAQALADQCLFNHDKSSDRKICSRSYAVGQNIFVKQGYLIDTSWKTAINFWYDQVYGMPNTIVSSFSDDTLVYIDTYTQVVWANTYEIGCGGIHDNKTDSELKIYVCNYGPAGNILGQEIYAQGTAASQCSNGISTTYPDLCA
ncbi:scoloptoxin SSD552-like [Palaemon carinicauda]|uniref:scoloptoxin SSD552-like n=1 Tax=Palaemon carinicauda TaxID=392227 RepID=UPI0035B6266C